MLLALRDAVIVQESCLIGFIKLEHSFYSASKEGGSAKTALLLANCVRSCLIRGKNDFHTGPKLWAGFTGVF